MARKNKSRSRENKSLWGSVLSSITGEYPAEEFQDENMLARRDMNDPGVRDELVRIAQAMQTEKPNKSLDVPFLTSLMEKNITNTIENESLIQMCPEIPLSAQIMVSSMLAPNDMRVGVVSLRCECPDLSPDKNAAIEKYLTKFFEDKLNLSTTLPKWIYNALYRSGATPLLLLPLKTLLDELNNPKTYKERVSNEGWLESADSLASIESIEERLEKISLFGFTNGPVEETTHSHISIENLFNSLCEEEYGVKGPPLYKENLSHLIAEICNEGNLTIFDNPDAISASKVKNKISQAKNKKKVLREYIPAEFLGLGDAQDNSLSDIYDNPLFMELPYESVIPIYTPGTPSDHIGYFVMFDEKGHPVTSNPSPDATTNSPNQPSNRINGYENMNRAATIQNLFQSQGYLTNTLYDKIPQRKMMENIYQSVIEYHLTAKTMKAGFSNVKIGSNPSLYRVMFSRYLAARKTKILFVPKEFMTYFCFQHGHDGCGVSKIEGMKWTLQLHVSLTMARVLGALNNSINRKRIIINAGDVPKSNAIQMMEIVKQAAIIKDTWSLTTNPNDMCGQIAQQGFSVEMRGGSGMNDFSIEKEPDQRSQAIMPDNDLAESIKNQLIMALGVPAAALNSVGENEYSRSVATSNLIFSRTLSVYQKNVISYMNSFFRNYIRYSKEILEEINTIVKDKSSETKKDYKRDEGNIDTKTNEIKKLHSIIDCITVFLPDPQVAPDKAQLTNIQDQVQTVQTLVEAMFNDQALSSVSPVAGTGASLCRSMALRKSLETIAKNSGLPDDLTTIIGEMPDQSDALLFLQSLNNVVGAVKTQDAVFRGATQDQSYTGPDGQPVGNLPDPSGGDDGSGDPNGDMDDDGGDSPDDSAPQDNTPSPNNPPQQ